MTTEVAACGIVGVVTVTAITITPEVSTAIVAIVPLVLTAMGIAIVNIIKVLHEVRGKVDGAASDSKAESAALRREIEFLTKALATSDKTAAVLAESASVAAAISEGAAAKSNKKKR